jgi:hypothetical protein
MVSPPKSQQVHPLLREKPAIRMLQIPQEPEERVGMLHGRHRLEFNQKVQVAGF